MGQESSKFRHKTSESSSTHLHEVLLRTSSTQLHKVHLHLVYLRTSYTQLIDTIVRTLSTTPHSHQIQSSMWGPFSLRSLHDMDTMNHTSDEDAALTPGSKARVTRNVRSLHTAWTLVHHTNKHTHTHRTHPRV